MIDMKNYSETEATIKQYLDMLLETGHTIDHVLEALTMLKYDLEFEHLTVDDYTDDLFKELNND